MWAIFRPDIREFVSKGKIWVNPDTGVQLTGCPFLRKMPGQDKYLCDIYFDRPEDCRFYPVTIEQMINDDCEMLEPDDLENPDQAQSVLDKLMADSRPPYDDD